MNIEFDVTENGSIDISKMNFIKIKEYVDGLKNEFINFNISSDTLVEIAKQLSLDERKNVQTLSAKLISFTDARKKEILRVKTMYNFDKHYFKEIFLAGVDEVGRGPLAGPIVAASVVLDLNISNDKSLLLGIKDSKKLSINHREELSEIIKNKAISYSIALLDNDIIDTDGIAWSNNQVFKIAVSGLSVKPDLVLTDGYPIKNFNIENKYAIKGDEKSASIACASIIAKVYRDNLMKEYAKSYPHYGFEQNAGYGTKEHIEAIRKYGPCRIHRMSFLNNIL